MAEQNLPVKSISRGHRLALIFFSALFTVLLIWLGSFVMNDIDSAPRPNYRDFEAKHVDPALQDKREELTRTIKSLDEQIAAQEKKREFLKDSTAESQNAMNQLAQDRARILEQNQPVSEEENATYLESQRIFLSNQKSLQETIGAIYDLDTEKRSAAAEQEGLTKTIEEASKPAKEEFQKAMRARDHRIVFMKLGFALFFTALSVWLFIKARNSRFSNLVYPVGIASLWILGGVIHDHFPSRYYKYIFLFAAIAAVVGISIYLVRLITRPSRKWLQKKYEEAYREWKCPACRFPMQIGQVKYMLAGKKLFKGTGPVSVMEQPEPRPYTCPACGTPVFEKCESCGEIRHAQLDHCASCGAKTETAF